MKIKIYRNKRNPHKYIESHYYKCGHVSARQFMHWNSTDVTNILGDRCFHRYKKRDLESILEDYTPVESIYSKVI